MNLDDTSTSYVPLDKFKQTQSLNTQSSTVQIYRVDELSLARGDVAESGQYLVEKRKSRRGGWNGAPEISAGKYFLFLRVWRASIRERSPLKKEEKVGSAVASRREAAPTLKIPRRCLLSPRDASPSPFLPRLDEQKRPALSSFVLLFVLCFVPRRS